METNIELLQYKNQELIDTIETQEDLIHGLRNKAQVAYAMVGEAVIFFEAVKADYTVREELRTMAKTWLQDYYEFFPQPEPIHHGNK